MSSRTMKEMKGKRVYVETKDKDLYVGNLDYVPEAKDGVIKLSSASKITEFDKLDLEIPFKNVTKYGLAWRGLRPDVYFPNR